MDILRCLPRTLGVVHTRVIKKLTAHVCGSLSRSLAMCYTACVCVGVCLCVSALAIEFSQVPHEKGLCKVKSESEKETDKRAHTHI